MPEKRFTPIARRINLIILISLFIGVGATVTFFSLYIVNSINRSTETNLSQQAKILYQAIEKYMLPGEASQAVKFFMDLKKESDFVIKLYRAGGVIAFSDSATVDMVNSNIGTKRFEATERITDDEAPLAESGQLNNYFQNALTPNPSGKFRAFKMRDEEGHTYYRAYVPLQNNPAKCVVCHGSSHTFRGVIDIRSDITTQTTEQAFVPFLGAMILVFIVIILAIVISQFLQRSVVEPVKVIGNVCLGVTAGNFEERVSVNNRDEIGVLGQTVNKMVEGLHERYELSKFVSSSTVKSLRGEKEGKKVPLTLLFSDIRGFTSYSEMNPPEKVVMYLNKILNFQSELIQQNHGDIDKYVGDEIVSFFSENEPELSACRAALAIRKELVANSDSQYGGLTVGIGIHYGEVILGMIGSDKRADFTVIGDSVNLAARLCGVAKAGQILISESLYGRIKEHVVVSGPYKIKVKGKERDVRVYLLEEMK